MTEVFAARAELGPIALLDRRVRLRAAVLDEGLLALRLTRRRAVRAPGSGIAAFRWPPEASRATSTGAGLSAGGLALHVEDARLELRAPSGDRLLHGEDWLRVHQGGLGLAFHLSPSARIFGFGQKLGPLDRRGRRLLMWNTDCRPHLPDSDPLYVAVPFGLLVERGRAFGVFVDHPGRSTFDLGATREDRWSVSVEGDGLDLYLFAGPDARTILDRFTQLTGRPFLPPRWALGYHQSRWSYGSADRVREIAREFRRRAIPCDAIYLDLDHMEERRVFTWDAQRFPDPAALMAELAALHFRLMPIVDPGVKADRDYILYREGEERGHFCRDRNGRTYVGRVWPGPAAFPDFERAETRHWWGEHLARTLLSKGVGGIWNDMNEPSNFIDGGTLPGRLLQGDPLRPHRDVHNLYGLQMCRATYEAWLRERPGESPFVLTRSAYAGIQRYAAVWMGDNASWWEHLLASVPLCLGMGLSGVPFVGADVGGFDGDCTAELLVRWMQLGAFLPLFRNHCSLDRRPQEPWAFGPEIEDLCRRAIGLRYRLLPYLWEQMVLAHRTGMPVARPLWLDFPQSETAYDLMDEFLFGPDILVAPVYVPGVTKRAVYLPDGEWVDLYTRHRHAGASWILADAPLERIPLFVRAGARIPLLLAGKQFAEWSDEEVLIEEF